MFTLSSPPFVLQKIQTEKSSPYRQGELLLSEGCKSLTQFRNSTRPMSIYTSVCCSSSWISNSWKPQCKTHVLSVERMRWCEQREIISSCGTFFLWVTFSDFKTFSLFLSHCENRWKCYGSCDEGTCLCSFTGVLRYPSHPGAHVPHSESLSSSDNAALDWNTFFFSFQKENPAKIILLALVSVLLNVFVYFVCVRDVCDVWVWVGWVLVLSVFLIVSYAR